MNILLGMYDFHGVSLLIIPQQVNLFFNKEDMLKTTTGGAEAPPVELVSSETNRYLKVSQ